MLTTPNISEKGFEVGQPFVQGGHTVVQGGQPFVQGGQPFVHSRVSSTELYIKVFINVLSNDGLIITS